MESHGNSAPSDATPNVASFSTNRVLVAAISVGVVAAFTSLAIAAMWLTFRSPAWSRTQDNFIEHTAVPDPEKFCTIRDSEITETSGLAISRTHTDCVWIHNDSGDEPKLFLVGPDGETRGVVTIDDEQPFDWEDMCSFELDGTNWLLIADVGDNGHVRGESQPDCRLILIHEPTFNEPQRKKKKPQLKVDAESVIRFQYPNGPVNCESVAVDPVAKEILLISKTDPFTCQLYRLPLRVAPKKQKLDAEPLALPAIPFATGMDVSSDGKSMIIVTMFNAALVRRAAGQSWKDALQQPATVIEIPAQPQCESVCFTRDATSILLTSEFAEQPIWKVAVPAAEPTLVE